MPRTACSGPRTATSRIGATGEKRWPLFCRLLDAEEWLDDPRFQTNGDRYEHRLALAELIDEKLQARTIEEWERFFNDAGIPAGPVYAMDSALDHPQVRHREMVVSRPHPVLGEVSLLGLPVKFSETPGAVHRIPPELGEQTDEILREIGVSEDELVGCESRDRLGSRRAEGEPSHGTTAIAHDRRRVQESNGDCGSESGNSVRGRGSDGDDYVQSPGGDERADVEHV